MDFVVQGNYRGRVLEGSMRLHLESGSSVTSKVSWMFTETVRILLLGLSG